MFRILKWFLGRQCAVCRASKVTRGKRHYCKRRAGHSGAHKTHYRFSWKS